jgi:predicted XRE-type DNA-binding protein
MKESIHRSSGNVFSDLDFPPEEAALLRMRADLMDALRRLIEDQQWTQVEAAERFGIAQSRVSDLVRGKWQKFSVDMLVSLALRVGLQPTVSLSAAQKPDAERKTPRKPAKAADVLGAGASSPGGAR